MITRYEIAARHPDGRQFLIAYAARLSRPGLLDAMRARGPEVIERLGIGETDLLQDWRAGRWPSCRLGVWWVGFTGRTQLQAKNEGELPYFAA